MENKKSKLAFKIAEIDNGCYCYHKRTKMLKCPLWIMFGGCPGDWHKGKWKDNKCPYFRRETEDKT